MIDLACVGHAAVDHHFEIEAFPARPTKTPATAYHHIIGGMAANAAVAATRLGGRVRLLGRVGDDEAGRFVQAELAALGVADVQLEAVAGAATSVSSVVVDAHGERQVFNHRGSALTQAHPLDVAQLAGACAPCWLIRGGRPAPLPRCAGPARKAFSRCWTPTWPRSLTCRRWCH